MNETREILEQAFAEKASAATQSSDAAETLSNNPAEERTTGNSDAEDPYLNAPASYKKEYGETFKTLPPELRKYLHERESETERGFSKLNNQLSGYKWLDDALANRKERLGDVSARSYFEQLASIDDCLATDPAGTLQALAEYYSVNLNRNSESASQPWQGEIGQLRQSLNSVQQFIKQQQEAQAAQMVSQFASAKDAKGEAKHPHFEQVRETMHRLLASGAAEDMEDAYEKAIWLTPDIRDKQLAAKAEAELKAKAAEAEKAKVASFSPKGKAPGEKAENLSTREILEKEMRAKGYIE
ncbi:MAG: hypothetical protein IJ479_02445 [Alphaproteobacteria bacterium]|nr:hypothetical protein [Alphaproteobacteria bacterium]